MKAGKEQHEPSATINPVFHGLGFCRSGTAATPLSKYPELPKSVD